MNHRCEQHNYRTLFCRLTPELSRPVAGRRTRASVAYSTWPTPRHGVGLNDLLGGPDAGEDKAVASLPKTEARPPERAPENYQPDLSEATASGAAKPNESKRSYRSQPTQRMRIVSAHCGLDRRSNVPRNRPKSNADRSRYVAVLTTQLPNVFCRLTPELSRPVAGRRVRASVAPARGRRHDTGSA